MHPHWHFSCQDDSELQDPIPEVLSPSMRASQTRICPTRKRSIVASVRGEEVSSVPLWKTVCVSDRSQAPLNDTRP